MRIIISPAKKMKVNTDTITAMSDPVFLEETEELLNFLRQRSYGDLKTLWGCNDGIQYTYMAPAVFEDSQLSYIQEHLRILSGFYGVLKPGDGVVPYRLEMRAKADVNGSGNLYGFWKDKLYREVLDESRVIINLASKEYSRCIVRYLQPDDRYITCVFGELENGKVVTKGVYAKMARGEMVRFMAEIHAEEPEQIKAFGWSGYRFHEDRSNDSEYVFVRTDIPGKGRKGKL